MSMAMLLFVLQAVAAEPAPARVTQAINSRPILWRSFRAGMTADEALSTFQSIEEVKEARSKIKKNKDVEFKIAYVNTKLNIGALNVTIDPVFENGKLVEILLASDECASVTLEKAKITIDLLKNKFGTQATERVVDENGVTIGRQIAFWDNETRVRMSFKDYNPAIVDHVYANGRLGSALSKLSNSLADQAAAEAVNKCPADRGARATMTLSYSSQATFIQDQSAQKAATKDQAKETAAGL